jgi:uncharacterized protein (TIGR00730 family)
MLWYVSICSMLLLVLSILSSLTCFLCPSPLSPLPSLFQLDLQESCDQDAVDEDVVNANIAVKKAEASIAGVPYDADEKKAAVSSDRAIRVAIFGSSRVNKGDALYDMAEDLGRALGKGGYHIMTGGYCGTMEAASAGAAETAGAIVEGVITPSVFPHRGDAGNDHLSVTTRTSSISERIGVFLQHSDAYVVLPGKCGTLAELILTWNVSQLKPLSNQTHLPLFVFRDPWEKVIAGISDVLELTDKDRENITFVDSVDDLLAHLSKVSHRV